MTAEILQMTEEEYRKTEGINFSSLKYMAVSPMKYKWKLSRPSKATVAMDLGTICHTAHLEPEKYDSVKTLCEYTRGTKKFDAEQEKYPHLIMVTEEERMMIDIQRANFRANEYYDMINAPDSQTEVAIRWKDAETGLKCKCRIDRYNSNLLIDVKTSGFSDEHPWINYFYQAYYHCQLAMYTDALIALDSIDRPSICLKFETVPCHDCVPYPIPNAVINGGRNQYRGWLWNLQNCLETDKWPGLAKNGLRELPVKEWALKAQGE